MDGCYVVLLCILVFCDFGFVCANSNLNKMKAVFKYIVMVVLSSLILMAGDIALNGEFTKKVTDFEYLIPNKIGVDNTPNNFLQVKLVNKTNTAMNDSLLNGLHIQLMTNDYSLITSTKVKNGIAKINISDIKFKNDLFVLISPQTGDEMHVNCISKEVEMEIDIEELLMNSKLNQYK